MDYTKQFASAEKHRRFDAGLREYMLKIYNHMALGLALTGLVAFLASSFPPLVNLMYGSGFGLLFSFIPFGIAFYFFMNSNSMSLEKARLLFWIYAGFMGLSLSYLGLIYTGHSIVRTFLICASFFGSMSLYGYTTEKDLTSIGSFLVMGLIGLIVVSLVNIFMKSSAVQFAISAIGVAIFMGLTAWDTQKLKEIYYNAGNSEVAQRLSIVGAFTLYLDFINLFLYLIRFTGSRRD